MRKISIPSHIFNDKQRLHAFFNSLAGVTLVDMADVSKGLDVKIRYAGNTPDLVAMLEPALQTVVGRHLKAVTNSDYHITLK